MIYTLIVATAFALFLYLEVRKLSVSNVDNRQEIVIIESNITAKEKDRFNARISLKDRNGTPIKNAFVSVYEAETGGEIYSYSILRLDDYGQTEFDIPPGKYEIIVSTDHEKNMGGDKFSFFFHHDLVVSENSNVVSRKVLQRVNIKLANFPTPLPRMKVEAARKTRYGWSLPHLLASNDILDPRVGGDSFVFYLSDGEYNLNLDTLSFSSVNPAAYALAVSNIQPSKTNLIEFNFFLLKKQTVIISDLKFGWFKLMAKNFGDFQGMYFGRSVDMYTNQDNLRLVSVYATLPDCVTDYVKAIGEPESLENVDDHDILVEALNVCTTTDIRYDMDVSPNSNGDFVVSAPNALRLTIAGTTLRQGEVLSADFSITNSQDQGFSKMYIHQLWDERILPKIFFKDSKGKMVHEADLFDERYRPTANMNLISLPICLPPGNYTMTVQLPIFIWKATLLSQSLPISIKPGSPCAQTENNHKSLSYLSWQTMYSRKQEIFQRSTGYIMTWPSLSGERQVPKISPDNFSVVSSCDDLRQVKNVNIILVDIKPDVVYNEDQEYRFTNCLSEFTQKNPGRTYVLKNNFWGGKPFPTSTQYILYHFYLTLHQGSNVAVGVVSDRFYELFYGYPDFFVIDLDNFLFNRTYLTEDSLNRWLSNYPGYDFPKIFYNKSFLVDEND